MPGLWATPVLPHIVRIRTIKGFGTLDQGASKGSVGGHHAGDRGSAEVGDLLFQRLVADAVIEVLLGLAEAWAAVGLVFGDLAQAVEAEDDVDGRGIGR